MKIKTMPLNIIKDMKILKPFTNFFIRLRYPFSLPEDIGSDLGFNVTNSSDFQEFIHYLINPKHQPSKLCRFMSREEAENVFRLAKRKEKFKQNSLFSYYFKGGWVEFILQFDDQNQLRRLYLRHKDLKQKHEISLHNPLQNK